MAWSLGLAEKGDWLMPFAAPLRVESGGQGVLMECDYFELKALYLMIILL